MFGRAAQRMTTQVAEFALPVKVAAFLGGLYSGFMLRDEFYYPNLMKTQHVVDDYKDCTKKIDEDIAAVRQRIKEAKEVRRKKMVKYYKKLKEEQEEEEKPEQQ